METTNIAKVEPVDMKLEVVVLGVSDVDRAKAFYENLGWRLDIDIAAGDFRGVQMTPHHSEASIIFGKGITSARPGSAHSLVLVVDDLDTARDDLIARGVQVSEVFHYAGGPFNNAVENSRVGGRDPQGRSYFSFASFEDPDGNGWLLQEITMRLPGREWKSTQARATDVATRAELLRETAEHHALREDARRAPLVGLVRALPDRARKRQQSGGGSSRRRPPHGGGPSCSSPMTPFEWPRSPSGLGSSNKATGNSKEFDMSPSNNENPGSTRGLARRVSG
jgi:catechol 2,3-dioxygenase-like lactoylglutathione lyase family enzyme